MPINFRNLFASITGNTTPVTPPVATTASDKLLLTLTATLRQDQGAAFMSHEQKFSQVKSGLSGQDKTDITTLLNDANETKHLDAVTLNFLKALVGLEALKNVDSIGSASGLRMDSPQKAAVKKWKGIVSNRSQMKKYYDAAIGVVDNPALKKEALELFAALPAVKPGMGADDFVQAGIWTTAPRGIAEMQKSARYLPGRQVLVETTLASSVPARSDPGYETARKNIGSFDPQGKHAVTHRATLVGEDPANSRNFLVKVDGSDTPLSVTKKSIYNHNHPHKLGRAHINKDKRDFPYNYNQKLTIDYNSPLAKAKLNEIALKMDPLVAQLDFTKSKTEASGGGLSLRIGGAGSKKMVEIQKDCNEAIFKSINMVYPKGATPKGRAPRTEQDAARQAIFGEGMCVQQSSVYGALLMPFTEILGIDGQYRSGQNYRHIAGKPETDVFNPRGNSGHGWWQNTYRPSMEMTVTDRTWNQIDLPLDRAYGFPYGDRYASRNIGGYEPKDLQSTDVNVSGNVTVDSVERQFSEAGDGREGHISLTQPNGRG